MFASVLFKRLEDNDPKTTFADFRGYNFGQEKMQKLGKILENNTCLQKLSIIGCNLTIADLQILESALERNNSVTEFITESCKNDSEEIKVLLKNIALYTERNAKNDNANEFPRRQLNR